MGLSMEAGGGGCGPAGPTELQPAQPAVIRIKSRTRKLMPAQTGPGLNEHAKSCGKRNPKRANAPGGRASPDKLTYSGGPDQGSAISHEPELLPGFYLEYKGALRSLNFIDLKEHHAVVAGICRRLN